MSILLRAASLTSLLVAVGCVDVSDSVVDETDDTNGGEQAAGSCPIWMCGTNSPEMDHKGLHELNTEGRPNQEGFYIDGIVNTVTGDKYRMDVYASEVTFTSLIGGPTFTTQLNMPDVANIEIVVKYDPDGDGIPVPGQYSIHLKQKGRVAFWSKPAGNQFYSTSFLVEWTDRLAASGKREWKNICSNPTGDQEENMGMNQFHSVLFENDRLSAKDKAAVGVDKYWFNIGCAGHLLAKFHLTGHSESAITITNGVPGIQGFKANQSQKTTAIKMFAGDYCGHGIPFTVAGTKLAYQDDRKWNAYNPIYPNLKLEARWTENGAKCMNTPRLVQNPNALGTSVFGTSADLEHSIAEACGGSLPPPCDGDVYTSPMPTYFTTGNPL